jgi:hypothetical protein
MFSNSSNKTLISIARYPKKRTFKISKKSVKPNSASTALEKVGRSGRHDKMTLQFQRMEEQYIGSSETDPNCVATHGAPTRHVARSLQRQL